MSKIKQHRYSLRDNRQDKKIERLLKFINSQSPVRLITKNKSQKFVTQLDIPKSKSRSKKPIINEAIHTFLEKRIEIDMVKTEEKKTRKEQVLRNGAQRLIGKAHTQQKILPLIHILKTQEAVDLKKEEYENKRSLLLRSRKFQSLFPKQIKNCQKTCSMIHHLPSFETESIRKSDKNRRTQKCLGKNIYGDEEIKNYDAWEITEEQKIFLPQVQFSNW